METLNGIEEAEWHAEGTSSDLGCLHLHWLGEAFWLSPGKEESGEKNRRVNVLGHCSLWAPSLFALQEAVLLNASSILLQVRGKKGFLAGGGWAVTACEKMGQSRFGARALPVGGGGWWGVPEAPVLSISHYLSPTSPALRSLCIHLSCLSARQSLWETSTGFESSSKRGEIFH